MAHQGRVREAAPGSVTCRAGWSISPPHVDVMRAEESRRFLTAILYLNDSGGGETIFPGLDLTVAPAAGRMVVFPPLWLFPHAGLAPRDRPKYILHRYMWYEPSGNRGAGSDQSAGNRAPAARAARRCASGRGAGSGRRCAPDREASGGCDRRPVPRPRPRATASRASRCGGPMAVRISSLSIQRSANCPRVRYLSRNAVKPQQASCSTKPPALSITRASGRQTGERHRGAGSRPAAPPTCRWNRNGTAGAAAAAGWRAAARRLASNGPGCSAGGILNRSTWRKASGISSFSGTASKLAKRIVSMSARENISTTD